MCGERKNKNQQQYVQVVFQIKSLRSLLLLKHELEIYY